MRKYFNFFNPNTYGVLVVAKSEKKQVPFSMERGNVKLMSECFLKHSRMVTVKMK